MRIYLAGPITKGPMDHNIRQALEAADVLMTRGHHPFIPHLCFYWQIQTPRGYEEWMAYDKSFLLACHAIVRLPGESSGADREMVDAKENGLAIFNSMEEFVKWDLEQEQEHVEAFRGECNASADWPPGTIPAGPAPGTSSGPTVSGDALFDALGPACSEDERKRRVAASRAFLAQVTPKCAGCLVMSSPCSVCGKECRVARGTLEQ